MTKLKYLIKKEFKNFFFLQLMATNVNQKVAKSCEVFSCFFCDYNTVRKSSYVKHLSTRKHILATNSNKKVAKSCETIFECENCEKSFITRSGLWRHNKTCVQVLQKEKEQNIIETSPEFVTLITELVKSNHNLQQSILDIYKNGPINSNNTIINSNNKSFNLNFFLNETCKDAMNIMDFADSIHLQLTDLENVGEIGYVEGISNIIVQNLNALDVSKRPIHCTDKKREILYVKDEDKWEKEDNNNNKVRKVIKRISRKNSLLLKDFRDKHPDYGKSDSIVSDQYNKLIIEAMGGKGSNDAEKEDKIIKNIAKVVSIDKNL